jgi:hypothetical protein
LFNNLACAIANSRLANSNSSILYIHLLYNLLILWSTIKTANKPVSLGRVTEHQSILDWLITGNNYGPLTHTPGPTDAHHCTELPGGYPYTFFLVCKTWLARKESNLLVPGIGLPHISRRASNLVAPHESNL